MASYNPSITSRIYIWFYLSLHNFAFWRKIDPNYSLTLYISHFFNFKATLWSFAVDIVAPFITLLLTPLDQILVDHSLHNLHFRFLQESILGPFSSKYHQDNISEGYSNVDCAVHKRHIFAYKVSKEALWIGVWY